MATAKKAPVKPAPTKKSPVKPVIKKISAKPEQRFDMPVEVRDWIDRAMSRMAHMQSEIDRLKKENADLKAYRKFAEHRILRSEAE